MLRGMSPSLKRTRTPRFTFLLGILGLALAGLAIAKQDTLTRTTTAKAPQQNAALPHASPDSAVPFSKKSLYTRLGGVFAISAVVDHFSDALIENPVVGRTSKNPALRKWSTENLDRLPGIKFMRTLWVCSITGGPFKYTATVPGRTKMDLEKAHQQFHISSKEFDEVAAELGRTLDFYKVPKQEKGEVLAAFAAHKHEVMGH